MSMPSPADPFELEKYKAALQKDLEQYRATNVSQLEAWKSAEEVRRVLHRAVVEISIGAMKTLLLVNGGAAIAILAFLGNALSKGGVASADGASVVSAVIPALEWFVSGTFSAGLTFALAYVTQVLFAELSDRRSQVRWGNAFRGLALAAAAASLVCFGIGAFSAGHGLEKFGSIERHDSAPSGRA